MVKNPTKAASKQPKLNFGAKRVFQLCFYGLNRRQVRICTRTLPSALKYAVKHCVKNHFIFFTIKKK